MPSQYRNVGIRRLMSACWALLLALAAGSAWAQTYTVTRTSYDTLLTDQAHSDPHLCGYAAYRVTANAAVADVWATIGNFAGGHVTLAATEDGVYHVGPIPMGGYAMAFFYLCSDVVPAIGDVYPGQTHTLTLWNRDPSLPGASQVNTSNWSLDVAHAHINAQSNKIESIIVSPPNPVVGGTFTIRVDGRTGTVGNDEHLIFTPAAHDPWPAAAFELESTYIDLPDEGPDPHNITDELVHTGLNVNSANTPYFAIYTFRVNRPIMAAAIVSPYGYIDSGVNLKHVDVSDIAPVIPPPPNPATLSKSANPTLITQGTATNVTFSIRISNSSDQAILLDQVRDVLPAGLSYVPGSALYNGNPLADPLLFERDPMNPLPEQNLVWIGAFPVPALGNRTLVFQANVPANAAVGTYDNCSIAFIDGTQIDLTADTTDNQPACATVTVIPVAPPGGEILIQKNTVGGSGNFGFNASPAPLANFAINVSGSSGVQHFTTVPGGVYTVQELIPAGWVLDNIACTITEAGSTPTSFAYLGAPGGTSAFEPGDHTAQITLGTDAHAQCTFTDSALGSLVIEKTTDPANTGQAFNFTGTGSGVGNFTLTPPATPTQTFGNLDHGVYTIAETVPAGWTLANIVCSIVSAGSNTTSFAYSGGPGATPAFEPGDTTVTVNLGAGDDAACRFDNLQHGSIALVKTTDGGDDSFGFDTNGSLGTPEVTITTVGGTGNALPFPSVPPGTYAISEIIPPNWTLANISCAGGVGSTFTYTGSNNSGATPGVFDAGDITATVTLAAGENITCTFHDDRAATITVRKLIVPFVNSSAIFDLLLAVGANPASIVANDVSHQGSGSITVPPDSTVVASETLGNGSPVTGYSSAWTCTGTAAGSISGGGTQTTSFVAPAGANVVCTFTNTDLGSISVSKNATPANSGQSFNFVGTGSGVGNFTLTPPATPTQTFGSLGAGAYSITEALPAGWTLTNIACSILPGGSGTSTFAFVGAPGGTAAFEPGDTGVQITLGLGDDVACTFTNVQNGQITVVKQAQGGNGSFGFDTNGSLGTPEVTITTVAGSGSAVAFAAALPGSYAISEIVPALWQLNNIACSSTGGSTFTYTGGIGTPGVFDPGDITATIQLSAGDNVSCTFTDARFASVTVNKLLAPASSTALFDLLVAIGAGTPAVVANNVGNGGSGSIDVPPNSAVVASELFGNGAPVSGFASTWACTGGAGGPVAGAGTQTGSMIAAPGAAVVCAFTNTDLGSIQVVKTATPGDTGQAFNFAGTGTGVAANFTLSPPATPAQTFVDLGSGAYSITEAVPAGWTLTNIACSVLPGGSNTSTFTYLGAAGGTPAFEPGDTSAQIALGVGDDVSCTFANVQNGQITIVKQTQGGDGSFGFDTNGSLATPEVTITTVAGSGSAVAFANPQPGIFAISEIVPAQWTLTNIVCTSVGGSTFTYTGSSAPGATPGVFDAGDITATVTLVAGDAVACTWTDARNANITVNKVLTPAGGTALFDLLVAVDGGAATIVANDVGNGGSGSRSVVANSSVIASETLGNGSAVTGFASNWACTGTAAGNISGTGTATSSFAAPPGADVVCTFSNTELSSIRATKVTTPANAGQAFGFVGIGTGIGNFTLTPPATPTQTFVSLGAGTYSITETVPAGWTLTDIACSILPGSSGTSTFAYVGAAGGTAAFEPGDTGVQITLGAGDDVDCTWRNDRNATITVNKVLVAPTASMLFDLRVAIGIGAAIVVADNVGNGGSGSTSVAANSQVMASETLADGSAVSGFSSSWACSNTGAGSISGSGVQTSSFVAPAGANIVCTFTNIAHEPIRPVPALSPWALMVLMLGIGAIGVAVLRR